MSNINISDGRKKYTINNDENRAFYVNLTDTNIAVRAKKAQEYIGSIVNPDGMDDVEASEFADTEAKKQIDYILDGNVSEVVFGNISPFAIVNRKTGQTFFEAFIDAILPEIEKDQKALAKSMQESEKRIMKYTKHYKK